MSENNDTRKKYSSRAAAGRIYGTKDIDMVETLPEISKSEKHIGLQVPSLSTTSGKVDQRFPGVDEKESGEEKEEKDDNTQLSAKLGSELPVSPPERKEIPPNADGEKKTMPVSQDRYGETKNLQEATTDTVTSYSPLTVIYNPDVDVGLHEDTSLALGEETPPKKVATENLATYSPLKPKDPELEPELHEETPLTSLDRSFNPFSEAHAEADLEMDAELQMEAKLEIEAELEMETERGMEPINETIHILGMGAVGKYIAHTLAGISHAPPITLLMHRPLMIQQWHEEGAVIRLVKNGNVHVQSGFHVESSAPFQRENSQQRFPGFGENLQHSAEPPNSVIDTLIVTTDPNTTPVALSAVKHRLRSSSTIFLVQDGLGIVQTLNRMVFPDSDRRPTYVLGSISHKIMSTEYKFTIEERESGVISCAKLPHVSAKKFERQGHIIRRKDFSWSQQARHLVATLARTPDFHTKPLGHKSFYLVQLEKLAVGAVIGPLTVAFDCFNDQLLYNYNITLMMKFLLKEISQIIGSLPELASLPNARASFSAERLEWIVMSTIKRTGHNVSSMLQHVRAGERTDIEFYTGYLIYRAAELGIACPGNHMLLHLVKGKVANKSREVNAYIPFQDER
jgi:2-dehydropantoate 2-reductase